MSIFTCEGTFIKDNKIVNVNSLATPFDIIEHLDSVQDPSSPPVYNPGEVVVPPPPPSDETGTPPSDLSEGPPPPPPSDETGIPPSDLSEGPPPPPPMNEESLMQANFGFDTVPPPPSSEEPIPSSDNLDSSIPPPLPSDNEDSGSGLSNNLLFILVAILLYIFL